MRLTNGSLTLAALLAGSALATLGAPSAAQAQSIRMSANIPFEFQFGNTMLPAGTYIVHRTGDAIQLNDGYGHAAYVLTDSVAKPGKSVNNNQLLFNRYGDRSFLSQVQWSGYPDARGVRKSADEIALVKAVKATSAKQDGKR